MSLTNVWVQTQCDGLVRAEHDRNAHPTWLRDNPDQARGIGISSATDARALAVVLDILAVEVPHLDSDLRRQTVQNCRDMLGETLITPAAGAGPDPTTARV